MEQTFKLSEVISKINMMLNYPAVSYDDLQAFFDAAIAEINTTLHTNIKSVTNMIKEFRHYTSKSLDNRVLLTEEPDESTTIPDHSIVPTDKTKFYYDTTIKKYGVLRGDSYLYFNNLYAVFNNRGIPQFYKAIRYTADGAFWITDTSDDPLELNLLEYLAEDWITLFIIPYVCFKYTCRDGGTSSLFAEEFTQGFQQLQESYNVPSKVNLATFSDKLAYRSDVEAMLPNLNVHVPTKAIYQHMMRDRHVNATYGNMFDRGGWYD